MQQLMPNPEDITDPTTAMNMALVLIAKESGCSECSSESRRSDVENQDGLIVVLGIANQNPNGNGNVVAARAEGNANGNNGNQIRCYNCRGLGHLARNCTVRPRRRDAAYLQTQLLIAQKEEAGIQLQAEEFDLMAAAADLDEIKEVNANCILMANLQASFGHRIFNMFTQEEQYTKLPEPIPEPHQVQQNDSNVIFKVSSVEQDGGTVDQHLANVEETQQCLTKKINALHLSSGKQITTLNEEISNLNKQLSKEKSTVSSLLEEKKKLKSDFKIREDELLDKQIQLENKIKELDNILVKTGQSIQTMHMLSPKPDSFYHTEQKMALGYQNPFYLKQAQQKQQSLYNGKVLLEKHDPPAVYDSEETLQLAQESRQKMKQLNKEIKPANYTKINHLSGIFVSQTAKSQEEVYVVNTSKTATVSKSISKPNEEFLDDTTLSVARKFLNEDVGRARNTQHGMHQPDTIADNVQNAMFDENYVCQYLCYSFTSDAHLLLSYVDHRTSIRFYQHLPSRVFQWTKDHPLEQVIGEPSRPVLTRNQLRIDGDMCMYALTVSTMEPKNVKEAMTDPAWIESMQEELLQFKRLGCLGGTVKRKEHILKNPSLQLLEWKLSGYFWHMLTPKFVLCVSMDVKCFLAWTLQLCYSVEAHFFRRKSLVSGPQRTRLYGAVNRGSRICVSIRLLCPSPLDADTVNGLWLSLQQDSNLL
ncbi:retrovirus-related pol polyprotein from transposon TNT 1-94 [Tanacetum coccineum]